jgi:hypothetical protein
MGSESDRYGYRCSMGTGAVWVQVLYGYRCCMGTGAVWVLVRYGYWCGMGTGMVRGTGTVFEML